MLQCANVVKNYFWSDDVWESFIVEFFRWNSVDSMSWLRKFNGSFDSKVTFFLSPNYQRFSLYKFSYQQLYCYCTANKQNNNPIKSRDYFPKKDFFIRKKTTICTKSNDHHSNSSIIDNEPNIRSLQDNERPFYHLEPAVSSTITSDSW